MKKIVFGHNLLKKVVYANKNDSSQGLMGLTLFCVILQILVTRAYHETLQKIQPSEAAFDRCS